MANSVGEQFLAMHTTGTDPLLLANAWDVGTAKLLVHLGFRAIATTSSGYAHALGRHDSTVTRDEALAHGAQLAAAVPVPVSADLEHGWSDTPDGTADTVRRAVDAGLAGCSIEDWDPVRERLYGIDEARDKVAAAAEAARAGRRIVLTGRAENHIRGNPDLADTIARLQAYQEAGADVLYAPGITTAADIASVVAAVDRPVNVLTRPGVPTVRELGALGVRRVSVGGSFAMVAGGALAEAATELLEKGSYGFLERAAAAGKYTAAYD